MSGYDEEMARRRPAIGRLSLGEVEDHGVPVASEADLGQVVDRVLHPGWRDHAPIPSCGEGTRGTVDELAQGEAPGISARCSRVLNWLHLINGRPTQPSLSPIVDWFTCALRSHTSSS
jgi:hypothetical protein